MHGIRNPDPSQHWAMQGRDTITSTMHCALGRWLCQFEFTIISRIDQSINRLFFGFLHGHDYKDSDDHI